MNIQSNKMMKALQRLSSGYRINSAADDPAGLAISERMRAQITGMNQGIANARNGLDMINTAEGAMTEVHSMLNRLVDISTRAGSETLTDTQRIDLQAEVDQIMEELGRTAEATRFGDMHLLNGKSKEEPEPNKVKLQIGPTAADFDQLQIEMPNLNTALAMLDDISVMTVESANMALENVNKAIESVSVERGKLGAAANRLERTINNMSESSDNLTEAESRIRDADMAKEMMEYVRAQVVMQGAQIAMAHAMEEPKRVLQLLQSA